MTNGEKFMKKQQLWPPHHCMSLTYHHELLFQETIGDLGIRKRLEMAVVMNQ